MGSRLKEDERNERNIRSLMKLPENRRCINCNSLGPQYVCTSFWTFVCTTCSGIHREFTHRVKSVSMAKFTTQEVSALQGGGNASAKEIYLKEWDAQRQSLPDSSNVERLRDFIKHVYVDRRYSGERSFDKPPRAKTGETEDTYQGGSRSPPYETDRRYGDRPSPGGRSDTSSRTSYDERRSPDFKKSPARVDVVNDWRREDRFANGRSPDTRKDSDISSPPIVRPVREILGESVSPLRVIEPPRANGLSRPPDASFQTQRTASSSSLASINSNPTELVRESSLIDFDADPEPASTAAGPQTQQIHPPVPTPNTAPFAGQPSNNNWASFDSTPVVKTISSSQAPPSSGNLLDMLSELSVPASGNNPVVASAPYGASAPVVSQTPGFSSGGVLFGGNSGGGQWQNVHSQQNVLPVTTVHTITSSFNQAWGGDNAPSAGSQVTPVIESKPAAAKQELPVDLFSSSYSPYAPQGQSWYPAPQYGMGYNMQYNVPQQPMPAAFMQQPSQSSNPFDLNDSPALQATPFPSMAPLQNALPNMAPPPGMQQPAPTWMPMPPPQGSSYGSSGPFMGQVHQNIPPQPRPQAGNFGLDMSSFGSLNTNQQQSGLYGAPAHAPAATPNTFSSNPFG